MRFKGPLISLATIIVLLVVIEVFLRIFAPVPDPYATIKGTPINKYINSAFPPGTRLQTEPEEGHTMRRVANENSLPIYDLAKSIPKSMDYFYDDFHFNENGAYTAGTGLATYLVGNKLVHIP